MSSISTDTQVCFCARTVLFLLWPVVYLGMSNTGIVLFAQSCFGYSVSFVLPYEFFDFVVVVSMKKLNF